MTLKEKSRIPARPLEKAGEENQLGNLCHLFQYWMKNLTRFPESRQSKLRYDERFKQNKVNVGFGNLNMQSLNPWGFGIVWVCVCVVPLL